MIQLKTLRRLMLTAGTLLLSVAAVDAQTIVDTWKTVVVPPPPELQPITVDSAHAALLILDINVDTCTEAKRPSCARSIPHIQQLLTEARSHHMMVIYSGGPPTSTTTTKQPEGLTPLPGEPMVRAGADKFIGSDLEKMLAGKDIHSIIVVGTSAQGAVLYTASSAALRNLTAIVPVDGYSSETPFAELYTAWHLKNAPATISSHVTLTKTDLITMR